MHDKVELQPTDSNLDPSELINGFKRSSQVQQAISSRLELARFRNPEISHEEVSESFYGRADARTAFWDYFHELKKREFAGRQPNFVVRNLPQDFQDALLSYFAQIRRNAEPGQADIKGLAETRSSLHTDAANLLVEHRIVPSFAIGRVLVHLMAVAEGIDQEDPDREEKRKESLKNL